MKKYKSFVILLVMSLLIGLTGCSSLEKKDKDTARQEELAVTEQGDAEEETNLSPYYTFDDKGQDVLAAMFFLGGDNQEMNRNLKEFNKNHNIPDGSFQIVAEHDNCEWYAIIPKYIGTKLKVEQVNLNEESGNLEVSNLLTETEQPVLLCCNKSDIVPSAQVTITYKEEIITYNPFLSLESGKLSKVERVYTEE
ncbi:hypothetical protein [[Clostridium] polysaccharolyticum]|uniref:Lipoprotein n=1 Tax=[Clostridium] polysaccharolyticum TaxID=29364 RepID=A0A1H9ZW14_9FIRM|nr:hypothetical protein [[Clostridium] polysaccharolyticum]SES85908.1 hypothetical protein SAMN04487772_104139 [[Clostridium] polysaccharolyticum]